MQKARRLCVILHRQAGLVLALVLVVSGVTGTILAFVDQIEPLTAPEVFRAPSPSPGAEPLDPLVIREEALARYTGSVINYLPLEVKPGRSFKLILERVDPASDTTTFWSDEWNELFVDPYTMEELGRRTWGDITEGSVNLVPYLYRLHWAMALDPIGIKLFGVAALIWTLDCFVGLYLTFPPHFRARVRTPGQPTGWWKRWLPSWRIRRRRGRFRLNFDLHRAGGLWLWGALLLFAWSSVFLNLAALYDPLMRPFGYHRIDERLDPLPRPDHAPVISFNEAARMAPALAAAEAGARGLSTETRGERVLYYQPNLGAYFYSFTSSNDFTESGGQSILAFDGGTGKVLESLFVQGDNVTNTVTRWLEALHLADVWGLPYRIAVALIGLLVPVLTITGLIIWVRKRKARIKTIHRYDLAFSHKENH